MARFFSWMVLLLVITFPISGEAGIGKDGSGIRESGFLAGDGKIRLAKEGEYEDDPATDDGEDLRDGDSDSNSNDDSDRDDG